MPAEKATAEVVSPSPDMLSSLFRRYLEDPLPGVAAVPEHSQRSSNQQSQNENEGQRRSTVQLVAKPCHTAENSVDEEASPPHFVVTRKAADRSSSPVFRMFPDHLSPAPPVSYCSNLSPLAPFVYFVISSPRGERQGGLCLFPQRHEHRTFLHCFVLRHNTLRKMHFFVSFASLLIFYFDRFHAMIIVSLSPQMQ